MTEELRTRAVEAIAELLDEGGLTHPQTGPRSELVAKDLLAAAEPFIRELVIAQVVEWARSEAHSYYRLDADVAGDNWMGFAERLSLLQFDGSR